MTLQDQMALTIRRAILAKPEGCPPAIVASARKFEDSFGEWERLKNKIKHNYVLGDHTSIRNAGVAWRNEYETFKGLLAEHADELRAICTENE